MKLKRDDVRELAVLAPAQAERRRLVSQAMTPAGATASWRDFRASEGARFAAALEGVTLLEAPDEPMEALSLALFTARGAGDARAHRRAGERPIEISRAASRRSCGASRSRSTTRAAPLSPRRRSARCARQAAAIGASDSTLSPLRRLLQHPLARFGRAAEEIATLAPLVEIGVLRATPRAAQGYAACVARARLACAGRSRASCGAPHRPYAVGRD